jgi:hypothetical protein
MPTEKVVRTREDNTEKLDVRRERPGVRQFNNNVGPLQFMMGLQIPGYRLYLATDKKGNDPYRIQKLLDPTVGYEFVTPEEVGLTEIMGVPITSDKVSIHVGGGMYGFLLKQPEEWAEADRAKKRELSTKGIYLDSGIDAMKAMTDAVKGGHGFLTVSR